MYIYEMKVKGHDKQTDRIHICEWLYVYMISHKEGGEHETLVHYLVPKIDSKEEG